MRQWRCSVLACLGALGCGARAAASWIGHIQLGGRVVRRTCRRSAWCQQAVRPGRGGGRRPGSRHRGRQTYGLIGPNGAGKTTTLRMLLGLVRPTSGLIRVLWPGARRPGCLRRLGAMGETAFYPFLSGRDNARAVARRLRCGRLAGRRGAGRDRAAERARDAVGGYSFGMQQRLGVAVALLKDPPLLILDEPANGWTRPVSWTCGRLIRTLGGGGRTIILQPRHGRGRAAVRPGRRSSAAALCWPKGHGRAAVARTGPGAA